MKNFYLLFLFAFPANLFAQGSNNKFLQLRDFSSGGIDANETFFVDRQGYETEGSPFLFEYYLSSTLITKDSATYSAKYSNINLINNKFEIRNNGQFFTYNKLLIQSVLFQYSFDSIIVINYFENLDKFGILLYESDLKLARVFEIVVKQPDYRADLNVGSKSSSYQVKDNYYVITPDGNTFSLTTKKDVKFYLSSQHPNVNKKEMLKGLIVNRESDLITLVRILDGL